MATATSALEISGFWARSLPRQIPPGDCGNRQANIEVVAPVADDLAACQHGDRAAQHRFYDRYHAAVYRLAVRMVGVQDAADVTQQTFLQALRSIGQFQGRSRIETWLYRLAINTSLQHLRRLRRHRHQTLPLEPAVDACHQHESELKEVLERALARIDPELRSLFLLREIEGFSYGDIAQTLHISEGTVGSRLNRARRELQAHLVRLGCNPRDFS